MKQPVHITIRKHCGLLAILVVCLLPVVSMAEEDVGIDSQSTINVQHEGDMSSLAIFPLLEQPTTEFAFDLGGSETRKLELQLAEPLTLNINSELQTTSAGIGSVLLDSSLSLRVSNNLDITTSLGAGKNQASFQPLGSIHCQNGVLDQGSYRASDCYFINQANVLQQDQVALGLRYGNKNLSTALSIFQNESGSGQSAVSQAVPPANPELGAGLLSPSHGDPLLQNVGSNSQLSYLKGETSGLDMEFQVGLAMDSAGDVRLGLQLTRVLDANYETSSSYTPGLQNWKIANPFDSARVSLDWSKGNFSGGIQGFYREQVQFLNRDPLEAETTFDVHFTWRAPWNANLSVGTTNVLNAGMEDSTNTDSGLQDPFESVYGRIPYVRYQQDL